jgi:predicted phage terminase large subunit-like protein
MLTTQKTPAVVTEAALVRSICLESFYDFVQQFWHVVVPEQPVWNWHIQYLCDEFQKDAERVFAGKPKLHDTIVNISPGSTKSTVLSIMAPAWVHARMPEARILAASHTQQLTFELGRKSRMVERSELYRKAFPEVVPAPDQDTKSLAMNTAGGGRMSATVGGMSPTGFHAHFILVDDPLDPQKARGVSELEIESANNFMSEVLPSRKVNKEVAITWLIMQRLHQNDPTGHMLGKAKDNIRHINIPAERTKYVKPPSLRKQYTNGLMDTTRLTRKVLDEAKVDLGDYGYSGQYLQHPVPRGGGMFKTDRIQVDNPAPLKDRRWVHLCRFWDKAGTKGGGAYTVGLLLGRWRYEDGPSDGSEDVWWVLHVERGQWDAGDRERHIVDTANRDGRRVVVGIEQEPGSGGKESAQLTVKRLAGFRVRVVPAVGTKEDRADSWATVVNMGGFRMAAGEWNSAFIDELRYFPFSTYKDQVDAGSGAFSICATPSRRVGAARV